MHAGASVGLRPVPLATMETRPFWEALRRHELQLPRCARCGRLHYPPPPRCPECLDSELVWTTLSGRGRLASWTTIHTNLSDGIPPPFVIGEVEPEEQPGLVLVALVVGTPSAELRHGMEVEIGFSTQPAPDGQEPAVYPEFRVRDGARP